MTLQDGLALAVSAFVDEDDDVLWSSLGDVAEDPERSIAAVAIRSAV